jgi:hypothetical protein
MLFVTNKTLYHFTERLKRDALKIIAHEMKLVVHRQRFEWQGKLYPLSIVVFEHPKLLGYFESATFSIGINKTLCYQGEEQVIQNILRHELAHYWCFLNYHDTIHAHGAEYRQACTQFQWGAEVSSSLLDERALKTLDENHERTKVIEKVQKLLKLGESQNSHEASLATIKANELLIKYNLSDLHTLDAKALEDEEVCRARVLELKRRNAKTDAIIDILKQFHVEALYAQGAGFCAIEVIGTRLNVEAADYLAKFLFHEMDRLLKLHRQQSAKLKGLRARNSFFQGLAAGFVADLKKQNQTIISGSDLVALNNKLKKQVSLFYPRLKACSASSKADIHAMKLGVNAAKDLHIRSGIKPKRGPLSLPFFN